MRDEILSIFSKTELNALRLDGIVQEINGYYFPSDSALTMSERAAIILPHAPKHALASHLLASWVFCCRFVPPDQLYFAAQPGKKLKADGFSERKVFNNHLALEDVVSVEGLLLTSPLRTFIDVLHITQNFSDESVYELSCLQRLAKASDREIRRKISTLPRNHARLRRYELFLERLGSLNTVHIINPVNPPNSVQ